MDWNDICSHKVIKIIFTLAIGIAGVIAFMALHLPLPFLFGPMTACLLAALAGVDLKDPGKISIFARTILGVAVGSSLTLALIMQIPQMATTLLLVLVYVCLIGLIGVPFFNKIFKFDTATSYFAAMPGGFQDMVVLGMEAGANPRSLSLIHASRALIIITLAPIMLTNYYGASLDQPIGVAISEVPVFELVLMLGAAIIGWKGGEKIGLFGAALIGPLILTGILSLTGFIHARPPAPILLFAQFFIGVSVGCYYVGTTMRELRHDVFAGACFAVILAVLAAIFTKLATWIGNARELEIFLSFSPGGQAEMAMLSIIVGADLGFVVLHHLARIMIVITLAPLAATKFLNPKKRV